MTNSQPFTSQSSSLATGEVPTTLLTLPFPAFVRTVCVLLTRLGYQNVGTVKPMHRKGRGRNAHGGLDIEAYLPQGLTRTRVIAQVKQYSRPVPRSFVNELRGTMLRHGAQQGLLITTATFSPTAREAASALSDTLPIQLVDGAELMRLLLEHSIPMHVPQVDSTPQLSLGHTTEDTRPQSRRGASHTPPLPHSEPQADRSTEVRIPASASQVTITLTLGSSEEQTQKPDVPSV